MISKTIGFRGTQHFQTSSHLRTTLRHCQRWRRTSFLDRRFVQFFVSEFLKDFMGLTGISLGISLGYNLMGHTKYNQCNWGIWSGKSLTNNMGLQSSNVENKAEEEDKKEKKRRHFFVHHQQTMALFSPGKLCLRGWKQNGEEEDQSRRF